MNEGVVFYYNWEIKLMEFLQNHMGDFAVNIAGFFTLFGEQLVLVGIIAFLYWGLDKNIAKRVCLNLLMALVCAPMIKNLCFRRRPYFDNEGIKCLKAVDSSADIYDIQAQGFSFPSGHSACATAAYPGLAYYFKKSWLTVIGIVLPIFVAISRFCLGVHYPTDTIVGLAIGCLFTFATPKLYDKYLSKWWFLIIMLLLVTPGVFYCQTDDYFSGYGLVVGCIFGFIFEQKYVNFEMTRKPLYMILRTLFGLGVFLLFAQGLKLVLVASNLTRVIRYAIGAFIAIGVYPMIFKKIEKTSDTKSEAKAC